MDTIIEKLFKQMELEDQVWKNLEQSEDYSQINNKLEELNTQIKAILEKELGREGRTLFYDQEQLYYQLLSISQKYFFIHGYKTALDSKE